jgi:hypothetical protein
MNYLDSPSIQLEDLYKSLFHHPTALVHLDISNSGLICNRLLDDLQRCSVRLITLNVNRFDHVNVTNESVTCSTLKSFLQWSQNDRLEVLELYGHEDLSPDIFDCIPSCGDSLTRLDLRETSCHRGNPEELFEKIIRFGTLLERNTPPSHSTYDRLKAWFKRFTRQPRTAEPSIFLYVYLSFTESQSNMLKRIALLTDLTIFEVYGKRIELGLWKEIICQDSQGENICPPSNYKGLCTPSPTGTSSGKPCATLPPTSVSVEDSSGDHSTGAINDAAGESSVPCDSLCVAKEESESPEVGTKSDQNQEDIHRCTSSIVDENTSSSGSWSGNFVDPNARNKKIGANKICRLIAGYRIARTASHLVSKKRHSV